MHVEGVLGEEEVDRVRDEHADGGDKMHRLLQPLLLLLLPLDPMNQNEEGVEEVQQVEGEVVLEKEVLLLHQRNLVHKHHFLRSLFQVYKVEIHCYVQVILHLVWWRAL